MRINLLIVTARCVQLVIPSTTAVASECLDAVLAMTQACTNDNLLYFVNPMRNCCGMGSEFMSGLIPTLFGAVMQNKRLVYVISRRPWHYNCPNNRGWACYLEFPCNDSVVETSGMDFQRENTFIDYAPLSLGAAQQNIVETVQRLFEGYKAQHGATWRPNLTYCDMDHSTTLTTMAGVASSHLFKLNEEAKQHINRINAKFHHLHQQARYLSLQIRLTDKKDEMSTEEWSMMTNATNTAVEMLQLLHRTGLNKIYIASDNCTEVGAVSRAMFLLLRSAQEDTTSNSFHNKIDGHRSNNLEFFGNCFQDTNGTLIESFATYDPRTDAYESTLSLFADVEMMRESEWFAGNINSGFVRMIYLSRYPRLNNTYALVSSVAKSLRATWDKNLNSHIDNIDAFIRPW